MGFEFLKQVLDCQLLGEWVGLAPKIRNLPSKYWFQNLEPKTNETGVELAGQGRFGLVSRQTDLVDPKSVFTPICHTCMDHQRLPSTCSCACLSLVASSHMELYYEVVKSTMCPQLSSTHQPNSYLPGYNSIQLGFTISFLGRYTVKVTASKLVSAVTSNQKINQSYHNTTYTQFKFFKPRAPK